MVHKSILSNTERDIIYKYLAEGTKDPLFKLVKHRVLRAWPRIRDDFSLIEAFVKKLKEEGKPSA